MAGFIGSLIQKGITGVRTLIDNAKTGKAAKAAGFTAGLVPQNQQTLASQNAGGVAYKSIAIIVGGILLFIALIAFIVNLFKSKR